MPVQLPNTGLLLTYWLAWINRNAAYTHDRCRTYCFIHKVCHTLIARQRNTKIKAIRSRRSANLTMYSLRFAPTMFWCQPMYKNEEVRLLVCQVWSWDWVKWYKVRSDNCQTRSVRKKKFQQARMGQEVGNKVLYSQKGKTQDKKDHDWENRNRSLKMCDWLWERMHY